jgi:hypothetical protein
VKNLAQLVLFFSITFILSLLMVSGIRFLFVWIEAVRTIPAQTVEPVTAFFAALRSVFSTAIYCTVLLSLSYSSRRTMPVAFSMCLIFLLTVVFSFGLSLALYRLETVESTVTVVHKTLGESGLRLKSAEVTIVIAGDPADVTSPRVVAIPDQPLIYQQTPRMIQNAYLALPPATFFRNESWFITSLGLDFGLVSEQIMARLHEGFFFFGIYLLSLALLLSSFRFVFDFSSWPLANLFFGVLIFRGILTFEVFLDAEEIQNLIGFFAGRLIPPGFFSPAIYTGMALLITLYTLLADAARGRRRRKG